MDRIRLLFVAPYEAMVSVIQGILSNRDDIDAEYCDNHDYWENYQGSLSVKYSDTIQKAVNQGFDVILSRFGSAYELRSITNTPIVDISISELDMIKAFRLAQNHGGKARTRSYFAARAFSSTSSRATGAPLRRLDCVAASRKA